MSETAVPKVCICVPAYNAERTLPETLDSLLAQTYRDLVILVVDNASTDGTLKVADAYAAKDPRVTVLRNAENVGGEGNFTRCLGLGRGEYTAIFHADDVYTPTIVEEQVAFLAAQPEAGAVFSMAQEIDSEGKPGEVFHLPPELRGEPGRLYYFAEVFRALLKYGSFVFCPGVMARTTVYRDYIRKWNGGDFKTAADIDVWLRILLRYPIGFIDKPLLHYRGAAPTSYSFYAVRSRTEPQDILTVLGTYIKGHAAGITGEKELLDFRLQELKDNINRGLKICIAGDRAGGRALLGALFNRKLVVHGLKNKFHLKVLAYGYLVYFITLLPLNERLRNLVFKARFEWSLKIRSRFFR